MLNVIDASKKEEVDVKRHRTAMLHAESRQEALKERKKFEEAFRNWRSAAPSAGDRRRPRVCLRWVRTDSLF